MPTITDKVRNEIPKILKNHKDGLMFSELFNELKTKFPNDLVTNEGKDRDGVLRGIFNKIDTISVPHLTIEKRGSNIYYVYVSGQLSKLERVSKFFVDEVKNKDLLKFSLIDLNKEERKQFKQYEELITKLHDLVYNK